MSAENEFGAAMVTADDNDSSETGQRSAQEPAQATGGVMAAPPVAGMDCNNVAQDAEAGPETGRDKIEEELADPQGETTQDDNTPPPNEALTGEALHAELVRLAHLCRIEYDREREAAAQRLGIRTSTLDAEVNALREPTVCDDIDPTSGKGRRAERTSNFADTDIANARRFARHHQQNVRFTAAGGWLVWNGTRWQIDEREVLVTGLAKETALAIYDEIKRAGNRDDMYDWAKHSQSRRAIEAMIVLARSEPGIFAKLTDFDLDGFLLNLANGTLDLRTGKLREHRRDDLISKIVPVAYDEDAEYELWDAFLWRVTGQSEEFYAYLRRLLGYLLTGSTAEQVLHFLHGIGANGKSVFCEVLRKLLGDYAIVLSPDVLMLKRHGGIPNDIARLRGTRMAAMNETTQGSRFDEAKLKDLTGGDTLTARFLHREFFDFEPTHKLLIRGNHKPAISGTDEGIWRRLRLVPFVVQIPPEEQDRQLIEKLSNELPGILNWAVQGCLEWQRDGLRPPRCVIAAVEQYRTESDTLGRFIADNCEVHKLAQVKSSAFYERYQQFAERSGERWIASKDLPAEMARRGFTSKKTKSCNIYEGIELRQPETADWVG